MLCRASLYSEEQHPKILPRHPPRREAVSLATNPVGKLLSRWAAKPPFYFLTFKMPDEACGGDRLGKSMFQVPAAGDPVGVADGHFSNACRRIFRLRCLVI